MDNLALFDIDETLTKVSALHIESISRAFEEIYGIDATINTINYHGLTEQQIIFQVLRKNGLDDKTIKSNIEDAMEVVARFFNNGIEDAEIIVLDGVRELLEELDKNNVLIGLVTGNLEQIARGKMRKVGLNHYLKIGGFGSDDIDRTNLVRLAIRRAEKNFGFKFHNNVFLFGDSPHDIEAGKEAGVKTVGVTTGIYSKKQLEDVGANFVVTDFKDKNEILKIIFQ